MEPAGIRQPLLGPDNPPAHDEEAAVVPAQQPSLPAPQRGVACFRCATAATATLLLVAVAALAALHVASHQQPVAPQSLHLGAAAGPGGSGNEVDADASPVSALALSWSLEEQQQRLQQQQQQQQHSPVSPPYISSSRIGTAPPPAGSGAAQTASAVETTSAVWSGVAVITPFEHTTLSDSRTFELLFPRGTFPGATAARYDVFGIFSLADDPQLSAQLARGIRINSERLDANLQIAAYGDVVVHVEIDSLWKPLRDVPATLYLERAPGGLFPRSSMACVLYGSLVLPSGATKPSAAAAAAADGAEQPEEVLAGGSSETAAETASRMGGAGAVWDDSDTLHMDVTRRECQPFGGPSEDYGDGLVAVSTTIPWAAFVQQPGTGRLVLDLVVAVISGDGSPDSRQVAALQALGHRAG